jgi:hypothetical protein
MIIEMLQVLTLTFTWCCCLWIARMTIDHHNNDLWFSRAVLSMSEIFRNSWKLILESKWLIQLWCHSPSSQSNWSIFGFNESLYYYLLIHTKMKSNGWNHAKIEINLVYIAISIKLNWIGVILIDNQSQLMYKYSSIALN